MADFDRFESLLSTFEDRNCWPEAVAGLAEFALVSLHVSPDQPTLSLTFELILPAADDMNAVTFTVVFRGVGDLAITRWGEPDSYSVDPREDGGWQAALRGAESSLGFTFASIRVDGVRYFRAGAR